MKFFKLQILIILEVIMIFTLWSFCQKTESKENKNLFTIPLNLTTQRPILELMINGKGPYQIIFDTGSSSSVIDEELATSLRLEVIGVDSLQTPGSDNKVMSKSVKVPGISFAGTDISEDAIMRTLSLRKMLPVDGLLSPTFFSNYLLTLDYQDSKLILSKGELNKADKDVTHFIQEPRVINLDVVVDDNKLEAHLDSGNPGGFDLPFSLKDQLHFKEEPQEAGVIHTPAANFKKWKATLIGDIRVGSVVYKNPDVNLVEGFQFVNLGYQVFRDLRITIDYKNNLIKFEKATAVKDNGVQKGYGDEENDFTGWYDAHQRRIFIENEDMYLQREGAPKLRLVKVKGEEYKMVFDMPVRNELPNVRFERDDSNTVIGLTFLFKDGREEFVKKDQ